MIGCMDSKAFNAGTRCLASSGLRASGSSPRHRLPTVSSGWSRNCVSRHSAMTRFSAGVPSGRSSRCILRLANALNSTPIWPAFEHSKHSGCSSRWMLSRCRTLRARSNSSPSSWTRRANALLIWAMSAILNLRHGWLARPGRADSCQKARMASGSRCHFASAFSVLARCCVLCAACNAVSAISRQASSRVASRALSSPGHLESALRASLTPCASTSSSNVGSVAMRSASCSVSCVAQFSLDHLLRANSTLEVCRASRALHRPAGSAVRCATSARAACQARCSSGHLLSALSVLASC